MSCYQTIALRLPNRAASQYSGYDFNSVVEFQGNLVFFGDTGIFEEGGGTLAGVDIDAHIDLPLHDFGKREQKSIEAVGLGYEAEDAMTVTITPDETVAHARAITFPPTKSGQVQQDDLVTLRKVANGKGRYWGVRIANTNGCDFSIDYVGLAPVVLKRRSI